MVPAGTAKTGPDASPPATGLALAALGVSISLDELAIGFSIGLVRLSLIAVITVMAVQAFLAAQLGLAIGTRIAERWRERAEQVAGLADPARHLPHHRATRPVTAPYHYTLSLSILPFPAYGYRKEIWGCYLAGGHVACIL